MDSIYEEELRIRKRQMNAVFVWTKDGIQKLQELNEKIGSLLKTAIQNVQQIKKELDKKILDGELLYKGYTIKFFIEPNLGIINGSDDEFSYRIVAETDWEKLNDCFYIDEHTSIDDFEKIRTRCLESVWGDVPLSFDFEKELAEMPLHYLTRNLLCNSDFFSYQDAINIEREDLRLRYQVNF